MNKSGNTLEKRIATALSADTKSDVVDELIQDTTAALAAAEAAIEQENERALDPALITDGAKARDKIASAAFTRDRLRSALPRLQERLKGVTDKEYYVYWRADCEQVKKQRDALVEEFRSVYPSLAAQLTDLLTRMSAVDREVSRINGTAPAGAGLHLREVELEARGLERFLTNQPSIADMLRLPNFEASGVNVWPPPFRVRFGS